VDILTRILKFIAPSAAVKRLQKQHQLRHFDAAGKGARIKNWYGSYRNPNVDASRASETLIRRSRELYNNNAYAKRASEVLKTNIIGSGIRASIVTENPTIKSRITQMWREWSNSKNCDWFNTKNFASIQQLATLRLIVDGEAFIVKRIERGELKLMVLSSDYLDQTKAGYYKKNNIIRGIEFGKDDRPQAYHFYKQLPDSEFLYNYEDSIRYKASDVIHLLKEDNPQQYAGVPAGHAVFVKMRDLAEYEDATLQKQKVAAMYAVFIKREAADFDDAFQENKQTFENLYPGTINYLNFNESIETSNPPRTENSDIFIKQNLKAIAAGYGITYESLAQDYSDTNFSASRMARLEMDRRIEDYQHNVIIPLLCNRVFDWFKQYVSIKENVNISDVKAHWTPPKRSHIDPAKEASGYKTMLRLGLMSAEEIIKENGRDPDDVKTQILEWTKWAKENEIQLDSIPLNDATRSNFQDIIVEENE